MFHSLAALIAWPHRLRLQLGEAINVLLSGDERGHCQQQLIEADEAYGTLQGARCRPRPSPVAPLPGQLHAHTRVRTAMRGGPHALSRLCSCVAGCRAPAPSCFSTMS